MKKLITLMLLIVSGSAQAAPVTIDFEGFPDTLNYGDFDTPQGFTVSGFVIPSDSWCCDMPPTRDGQILVFFNTITPVASVAHTGGLDFSLFSLDLYMDPDPILSQDEWVISAYESGGGLIAQQSVSRADGSGWRTISFDSSWTGISELVLQGQEIGPGYDGAVAHADNIVVNAIPIPAAVWLFASGLGLLGWMRSRRTS
jgi:hypothetical protein